MKEIVIKIPDKMYRMIMVSGKADIGWIARDFTHRLVKAVKNGTELPKGHDKLIAEPTEKEIAKTIGGQNEFADCIREAVKAVFNNAEVLVEADKQ